MSKIEILAPVGSEEMLHAAVFSGADAVYLGGQRFGARAFAGNFSREELLEGLSLAHLWNRKIYLTVNTLTKQDETTTAFTDTLTGVPGTAPYSQNYSFATVPAGTYTLKVEKKGHAPWTEEITVATDNIGKDVTVYLWGDVNRDGDVDLYDLLTLQQYLAKNITLTETQLLISDVTKDDKVDLYDLLTLQQYLARNITSFD